jgi:hypothetical protein
MNIDNVTQGSRKLEPWAEISERLRRIYLTGAGLAAAAVDLKRVAGDT